MDLYLNGPQLFSGPNTSSTGFLVRIPCNRPVRLFGALLQPCRLLDRGTQRQWHDYRGRLARFVRAGTLVCDASDAFRGDLPC